MEPQEKQKQPQFLVKQGGQTQNNQTDSLFTGFNRQIRDQYYIPTMSSYEQRIDDEVLLPKKNKEQELQIIQVQQQPSKIKTVTQQVSKQIVQKISNYINQVKQLDQNVKTNTIKTKIQNQNIDKFGLYKFSLNTSLNNNIQQCNTKKYSQIKQYFIFVQQHREEFAKFTSKQNNKLIQDKLKKVNIKIIKGDYGYQQRMQTLWRVRLVKDHRDYKRVTYSLNVSKFQINITLHIINKNDNINQEKKFGSGGFGQVFLIPEENDSKQSVCLKRIKFQDSNENPLNQNQKNRHLQQFIKQVGICKLLGQLNIGPKHLTFLIEGQESDIVVFNNSIVYKMQKGDSINDTLKYVFNLNGKNEKGLQQAYKLVKQLQTDLGKSISQLHLMKMVHRDIKPGNIIYHPVYKKFLLVDFGFTHSLSQKMNQQSNPFHYRGSRGYMLNSLQSYKPQEGKKVFNLYYNDYNAFKKTIQKVIETLEKIDRIQSPPSLQILSWDLPIQVQQKQCKLTKISRQLNFMRFVYNFRLEVAWKWKQKINLIKNKKQKDLEKDLLNSYFMIEKATNNKSNQQMKKLNVFEHQQGRNSIVQYGLISLTMTFDYFLYQKSQELFKKATLEDQKYNKQNETTDQFSQFTFGIIQFIINSNILAVKNKGCDWIIQMNQRYLQLLIKKLSTRDLRPGNIKCVYYTIMGLLLSAQTRNDPHNLSLVEQIVRYFKRQFPTLEIYKQKNLPMTLIGLCDQFATTRLASSLIPKLVDIALDVRQFYGKYLIDSTISIIISSCLNMIQDKKQLHSKSTLETLSFLDKNYDWKQMDRLIILAQDLLIKIYGQNFKQTRLFTKINFVKGIHFTNLEQWKQAETYSLQTLKMVVYHFGQQSDFNICTLFNLANIYDKMRMNEKDQLMAIQYFNKGIYYMQITLQHYNVDMNMFSIYENLQQIFQKFKVDFPQIVSNQLYHQMKSLIQLHKYAPRDWKKQLIRALKQYKHCFFKLQNIQNWKVLYINAFYILFEIIKVLNYVPNELEKTGIAINTLLLSYEHPLQCCIDEKCQSEQYCCKDPHKSDYYYYKIMIQNKRQSQGMKDYKNILNNFKIYNDKMLQKQKEQLKQLNLCPAFPDCKGVIQDLCQNFKHFSDQQIKLLQKHFPMFTKQQIFEFLRQ